MDTEDENNYPHKEPFPSLSSDIHCRQRDKEKAEQRDKNFKAGLLVQMHDLKHGKTHSSNKIPIRDNMHSKIKSTCFLSIIISNKMENCL